MVADQLIAQSNGSQQRVRAVGVLRYVKNPDHQHWHYLGFDRYELQVASLSAPATPDNKSGFCLGDRYSSGGSGAVYTGHCGLGQTTLLSLTEGISVGWGDDYGPQLEGQYVDVTGVPGGLYYLVHRANMDGRLREQSSANNAASALIRLDRQGSRNASVTVLRTCPDSASCPL
jgi:hypothetical protein